MYIALHITIIIYYNIKKIFLASSTFQTIFSHERKISHRLRIAIQQRRKRALRWFQQNAKSPGPLILTCIIFYYVWLLYDFFYKTSNVVHLCFRYPQINKQKISKQIHKERTHALE